MKICGTNLIPIFVTIVFCGIIFIYFNMRLAEIRNTVEKQNRVLTAFITNVQNDIKGGGMMFGSCASSGGCVMGPSSGASSSPVVVGANHLASAEALQAVKLNEKIVVSDDEDEDSDSESDDDDSSSESDGDSDDSEDDAVVKPIIIQPVSLNDSTTSEQNVVSLELIPDVLPLDFESLPTLQQVDFNEDSLKVIDLNISSADTPSADTTSADTLSADTSKTTDVHYEQMKVDDLRKIVTDLNLIVKDEAKKLKKPELLALLKSKQ